MRLHRELTVITAALVMLAGCGQDSNVQILENIPEEQIGTCVIFLALRGGINTGKFGRETSKGTRQVYPTFEKHLQKVISWKKEPKKFIEELLEVKNEEPRECGRTNSQSEDYRQRENERGKTRTDRTVADPTMES